MERRNRGQIARLEKECGFKNLRNWWPQDWKTGLRDTIKIKAVLTNWRVKNIDKKFFISPVSSLRLMTSFPNSKILVKRTAPPPPTQRLYGPFLMVVLVRFNLLKSLWPVNDPKKTTVFNLLFSFLINYNQKSWSIDENIFSDFQPQLSLEEVMKRMWPPLGLGPGPWAIRPWAPHFLPICKMYTLPTLPQWNLFRGYSLERVRVRCWNQIYTGGYTLNPAKALL